MGLHTRWEGSGPSQRPPTMHEMAQHLARAPPGAANSGIELHLAPLLPQGRKRAMGARSGDLKD